MPNPGRSCASVVGNEGQAKGTNCGSRAKGYDELSGGLNHHRLGEDTDLVNSMAVLGVCEGEGATTEKKVVGSVQELDVDTIRRRWDQLRGELDDVEWDVVLCKESVGRRERGDLRTWCRTFVFRFWRHEGQPRRCNNYSQALTTGIPKIFCGK